MELNITYFFNNAKINASLRKLFYSLLGIYAISATNPMIAQEPYRQAVKAPIWGYSHQLINQTPR